MCLFYKMGISKMDKTMSAIIHFFIGFIVSWPICLFLDKKLPIIPGEREWMRKFHRKYLNFF